MKKLLSTFFGLWMMLLQLSAQTESCVADTIPHLSHFFIEKNVVKASDDFPERIVGCAYNDSFVYCSCTAFRDKDNNYQATIFALNSKTGEQSQLMIPFPEAKANMMTARNYWIYAINVTEEKIILSTQYAILFYGLDEDGEYELQQRVPTSFSPEFTYYFKGSIYYSCQDNEMGFRLVQQKINSNKQHEVQQFIIDAPFLLQYGPNGFIKATDEYIYFLNSPKFCLQKYSLTGNKIAEINIEIPNWHTMDPDYIQEMGKMEYGGDRAMYSYYHSKKYSFPLEVIPLNDRNFLLTYHQYDVADSTDGIDMILLCTNDDWSNYHYYPVSVIFPKEHVVQNDEFPIYYHHIEKCLSFSTHNMLWQLVKETDVPYRGKKWGDYENQKQEYLKKNDVVLKLRVMEFKDNIEP